MGEFEEDDEDADDKPCLQQGEHQAEKPVKPPEHDEFRYPRQYLAQNEKHQHDSHHDHDETDDVQHGLGYLEIGL